MAIQLIGKDDSSFDDAEVLTGRWQAYIDSYVSVRITHFFSFSPSWLLTYYDTEREYRGCITCPGQLAIPSQVSPNQLSFYSYTSLTALLFRNIPAKVRDTQPDVVTQDGQEIKVCVRTYRLFYVPEKEDYLWKFRSKEEVESIAVNLKKRNALRERWLEKSKAMPPPLALKEKEKEVEKETERETEQENEKDKEETEKEAENEHENEGEGEEKTVEKEPTGSPVETSSATAPAGAAIERVATPPSAVTADDQKEAGEISESGSVPPVEAVGV
jgi:paired amphipathic helix protein Sin3a